MPPARCLSLLIALAPAPAFAQACGSRGNAPDANGRVFGHFAYGDVADADLAAAPPGFALRGRCMVQRAVLPDLERLLAAAAADPDVGGTIHGLSCHRSIERQDGVYCSGGEGDAAARAVSVAPPGHSEHTTGYAIDFAVRPSPNCPDAEACMAATRPARWLRLNAPRYGFELSFPPGNRQNVKWEPWHWRWVGTSPDEPGAAKARFAFARARRLFPADPAIPDPVAVVLTSQPPPPAPPADTSHKRGRGRR